MSDRERSKSRDKGKDEAEETAEVTVESDTDIEALDDLLDEIDEVLEENAEEFVKNYVQKGGQGSNDRWGRCPSTSRYPALASVTSWRLWERARSSPFQKALQPRRRQRARLFLRFATRTAW